MRKQAVADVQLELPLIGGKVYSYNVTLERPKPKPRPRREKNLDH